MKIQFGQGRYAELQTKDILSHHDVVFRAPLDDPMCGLPLGDGSTGLLVWPKKDALCVRINHTDFVDDTVPAGAHLMGNDRKGEEVRLRGGALLEVQFPFPIFESAYQKEYEARLSLSDAVASVHAQTPFAGTDIRIFASGVRNVAVMTISAEFDEAAEVRAQLSRWGSRSFNRWYSRLNGTIGSGLDGTAAIAEDGCMCITQELHGSAFCVAVLPVSQEEKRVKRAHSRLLSTEFAAAEYSEQTYYIAAVPAENTACAKEKALSRLRMAAELGAEELYREHAEEWTVFWNKSYISLPEKQDFLENIWYLNLYYANCQMRGEYPHLPWAGVWGNFYDYSPWGDTLHWNTQAAIFPLDAANHPELEESYFRYCRGALPHAEYCAKNYRKKKGAFFTDVCDLKGRMCNWDEESDNLSPGAHIALEMYQHYLYSGDEEFLKEYILPVMRGAAQFYLDMLEMGEDGYYHIYETSAYEEPFVRQDDCVTDTSAIRALFQAMIELVPEEEAAPYRERLEKLAPFLVTDFCEEEVDENGIFLLGQGKGRKVFTDKLLAAGKNPRLPKNMTEETLPEFAKDVLKICGQEYSRLVWGDVKRTYYSQPDQEIFTVFPANLIGVGDKGTDLYNWVANCVYVHRESCASWCRMPIFLARMGMGDLLEKKFEKIIPEQILYPQGIGSDYMPDHEWHNLPSHRWMKHAPVRHEDQQKTTIPAWSFRYFNFEVSPIMAAAVNEMLLQSYDGVIRLFPALVQERMAAFRLAATGGRMVEAVYDRGACEAIITCSRQGSLSVAMEQGGRLCFTDADTGAELTVREENGVYTMEAAAGQRVCVRTEGADNILFERDYSRNMDVKRFGEVKLGTEKEF